MRRNIVAGNWKMNMLKDSAKELVTGIVEGINTLEEKKCEVIVCPPFPFLESVRNQIADSPVKLAAQNCSQHVSGAYTGEVSAQMVKDMDAGFVLIGHSERREYFSESNEELAEKVNVALSEGLSPVFCCGEPLNIRETEAQEQYVCKQIEESLFHLDEKDFSKIIIAYEPIWAIGTGKTASSIQAQEMHASIRTFVETKYGKEIAENLSILYGGSCKPSNAKELFACPDVDGGLIGGASLKANDFIEIIKSF